MCGIIGVVGQSTNIKKSKALLTHLMRETEVRGRHATGFFRVSDEGIDTHKATVPSSKYVRTKKWRTAASGDNTVLIGHARAASIGKKDDLANAHPFVNKNGNIAMVHNGTLWLYEYLKGDYRLDTKCDSELVLRIVGREKGIMRGIRKVFELLGPGGDFACEMLHTHPNTNKTVFYVFRDPGRPVIFVDAREQTGQYFFCSEKKIWDAACRKAGRKDLRRLDQVEMNTYEIWAIDPDEMTIRKHAVARPKKDPRAQEKKSKQFQVGTFRKWSLGAAIDYHKHWAERKGHRVCGSVHDMHGLANWAVPADQVAAKAREIAEEIATAAPLAVRMAKRSLYENVDWDPVRAARGEAHAQSRTLETEDSQEGIRALLEKRPPDFSRFR